MLNYDNEINRIKKGTNLINPLTCHHDHRPHRHNHQLIKTKTAYHPKKWLYTIYSNQHLPFREREKLISKIN